MAIALCLWSGCRTLDKGPVPQAVAECRQLTQQGANALERDDWRRSETLLEKAVTANPTDLEARRFYAETLWHRGATVDALAQLEAARKIGSCDPALTVRTGEMYLELGQVNTASELADEALRVDPKHAGAWALKGRVADAGGRADEALANYQRSLGYAPDDFQVAMLVAETYRKLNQPEQALLALQNLADRYPQGEAPLQVLHMQGLALAALQRHADAARVLTQAAQRSKPSADLLYHLAQAELLSGHAPQAQQALQQALVIDPKHAASQQLSARMAMATPPLVR